MNKTVTINISGIIFHIEEDAYDKLSKYLATIKGYFSGTDGGSEIMGDIESRIAEMLQGRTSAVKQVVLMADVDFVMDNMGRPEDFAGEQVYGENTAGSDRQQQAYDGEPVKKRLFRDPDSKVLGGVCAGIGNYFDFDATFLRIILALVTFFSFGSLIIVYIILWIAIPEAKTTADKLAMKGEKIDINNISKSVKEEAEQFKKRVEKYGNDVKDFAQNNRHIPRNGLDRILAFLGEVFRAIGKVVVAVVGVFFIMFGLSMLVSLLASIFGFSMVINNIEVKEWVDAVLMDGSDFVLGAIGIILFWGVPAVMLTYLGIRMLFRIRTSNRWVSITAGSAWALGWILVFYVGTRTVRDFSNNATVKQAVAVKSYDTLHLSMNPAKLSPEDYGAVIELSRDDRDFSNNSEPMIGHRGAESILMGRAQLTILKSQSDQVEMSLVKMSKGLTRNVAMDRVKNISYSVVQKDSLLLFDQFFIANNMDKFRMQELKVILRLPVNKVVYLDKSIENILYDIENVSNTYSDQMVNRRWIMTEHGLKCLDCEGLDNVDGIDAEDLKNIRINADGVHINGRHSHVNIDSNGVNIKSGDAKIKIDEHGIHVHKH